MAQKVTAEPSVPLVSEGNARALAGLGIEVKLSLGYPLISIRRGNPNVAWLVEQHLRLKDSGVSNNFHVKCGDEFKEFRLHVPVTQSKGIMEELTKKLLEQANLSAPQSTTALAA